jgi:hypothetical protein
MMPAIPIKIYVYGAILLAIVIGWGASLWWAYGRGEDGMHDKWLASIAADSAAQARRVQASDIVTTQVVTQTIERVRVVLTQGATITKEVPVYVTSKANASCHLTVGFARVLNAAAGGQSLDAKAAPGAYDSPLGTSLSDAAGVISDNYSICRADQERLRGLQRWITEQIKVVNEEGPH